MALPYDVGHWWAAVDMRCIATEWARHTAWQIRLKLDSDGIAAWDSSQQGQGCCVGPAQAST
jgi:hypothetical protein